MKKAPILPTGPKRRRNPQDATLRNIRALKLRVKELEKRVDILEDAIVVTALDGSRRRP